MAAECVLASAELDVYEKRIDGQRLGTGVRGVDEALGGGVKEAGIVCVSGEGRGICRNLLVESLLRWPGCSAAVVDATGEFDVVGVYLGILEKLGATEGKEEKAKEIMERVEIMRVFDFMGVREAVGEVRRGLEGRVGEEGEESGKEEVEGAKGLEVKKEEASVPKKTVIADSEDEDEDEEMLFDTSDAVSEPIPQHVEPTPASITTQTPRRYKFILIDNLAHVLATLFKKDSTSTHAVASTFLHALTHLTRTHNLVTVLANPAAIPPPQRQNPDQPKQVPPLPQSIFASNNLTPSLTHLLTRYADTGFLVSTMPKGKMDARVYYREGNEGKKNLRGVEMVRVCEVLWERYGVGVGGWGILS